MQHVLRGLGMDLLSVPPALIGKTTMPQKFIEEKAYHPAALNGKQYLNPRIYDFWDYFIIT